METGGGKRCGRVCMGYNSIEAIRRESVQCGVVARTFLRAKVGLYRPDHAVFLEERTGSGRNDGLDRASSNDPLERLVVE